MSEQFVVGQPSANLFCPICRDLFKQPVITRECSHSFCWDCINKIETREVQCPLCRGKISLAFLHPNLVLESLVSEVLVWCRLDCGWKGPYFDSQSHEITSCPKRTVSVPSPAFPSPPSALSSPPTAATAPKYNLGANGEELGALRLELELQRSEIRRLKQKISPDDPLNGSREKVTEEEEKATGAATSKEPAQKRLLDIDCSRTLYGHTRGVTALAFDDNFLFSGSHDTKIRVWDAATFEHKAELEGHAFTIWSLLVHKERGRLFSGSADGTTREWALTPSGVTPSRTFRNPNDAKTYSLAQHDSLILSSGYKLIHARDSHSGDVVLSLPAHTDAIWSIKVKDQNLYSASEDKTLKVWDLRSLSTPIQTLSHEESRLLSLEIGSNHIFAGTQDAQIKVWNGTTFDFEKTLKGHNWEVWQLAYSKEGYLFSGSFDHTIRMVDATGLTHLKTLKGHNGFIHAMLFHQERKMLVTGSGDKSIKIWTVA